MKTYSNIIKTYAQALKDNDYDIITNLFSKNAKIFSFLAGEQPPSTFFQNLFANSDRSKVEVRNIFFDEKNTAAAYIYIKAIFNKKYPLEFEAVDIFEFDSEDKIQVLKIILDTYPIRVLKKMQ